MEVVYVLHNLYGDFRKSRVNSVEGCSGCVYIKEGYVKKEGEGLFEVGADKVMGVRV